MNFNSVDPIMAGGFSGFVPIHRLYESCQLIPNKPGVYLVLCLDKERPVFLMKGSGGLFKGMDPNVPIDVLESKWVASTLVAYIGKAGGSNGATWSEHSLRRRISQYMDFGKGKTVGHRGGRYIWQLQGCENLLLCWRAIARGEGDPSIVEKDLINEFVKSYGRLPYANLRY